MSDGMGAALWALRVAMMTGGGVLVERGALAQGELDAIVGGLVALAGVVWSFFARRAQLAAEPR